MTLINMRAAALALALLPGTVRAESASVAEQTVDVMNTLWGAHPGLRANHARGIVVDGSFTPSAGAKALSKAAIFAGPAVPVTVRFSDATGLPKLPDGDPNANPHGMAIKFQPPSGDVDLVLNSLAFFPVATGEEFRDLLTAVSKSGPGAAKPTPLETFVANHPAVPKALGSAHTPASFATERYNGIDAFVFVNQAGRRQPFRFEVVPAATIEHLAAADAAKRAPDFLMTELPARLGSGPVVFNVRAVLAEPGDQTADPTQPWPESRKATDLGTLTLTRARADSAQAERALLFLPGDLQDGIEPSDDKLIDARNQAYAVSYGRRQQ